MTTNDINDKFNPAKLRLSQDFGSMAGVKKHITTIPVRKPSKQEFIRVHPESNFQLETMVLELKEEREIYLIDPALHSELLGDAVPKILRVAINLQKALFLWPIRLPDTDGKLDPWNSSASEAANIAKHKWIRVTSNKGLGAYDIFEALKLHNEPEWPDMDLQQILSIAFKGHHIDSPDHIVLRRLRGEV